MRSVFPASNSPCSRTTRSPTHRIPLPWVVVDQLQADARAQLKAPVAKFRLVSVHLPYGKAMRPLSPAKLGPKLFHLHLDEVRRADWREHFVPGTGIIDWSRLFSSLAAVKYSDLLVLELLYDVGAEDSGASITRAFTPRTPEGAAARGLIASRDYLASVLAAPRR